MIYRKIINKYNYIKPEALVVPTEASPESLSYPHQAAPLLPGA